MDARELRIGNWVYDLEKHTARQVEGADLAKATPANNFELANLEPFQLDKQWLLRAGFVEQNPNYLEHYPSGTTLNLGQTLEFIKYIHKLQNMMFAVHDLELQFKTLG